MSQANDGSFPTRKKKYSIIETNGFIPFLERAFLRLRQLNESVNQLLHDLGIDSTNLDELDLLQHTDTQEETAYIKLTDLKLYLCAIQDTVKELSSTGCLIDNLDLGKVAWLADDESTAAEITWSFGDKSCQLHAVEADVNSELHVYPDQIGLETRISEE